MNLSIIIVNHNTKDLLLKCIKSITKSLKNSKLNYEIIVVDNNSQDESITKIKNEKLKMKNDNVKFKIIQNKENAGFGRANNQGAKIAKGEYLLFLNTDIEVLDNAVEKLYQFIKENPKVAVAGGRLYNEDRSKQASCGPFYSLIVTFIMLFFKGDKLGITRRSPKKVEKVDWVSGACFILKKEDFLKVGGFDENIFMYMEEVDLMYRLKEKGWETYFYPKAEFIHLGAATSKNLTKPILNIYKGLLYFYKKHHSDFELAVLKTMLKIKAAAAFTIGKITNSHYLMTTYEKALKLVG